MLCFRCEHRAKYLEKLLESKYSKDPVHIPRPRFECGNIDTAVMGCYMFKPVKPVTIKPRDGDNRPLSLDILSCRVEQDENIELNIVFDKIDDKILPYWTPKKPKT